jgi:hypothetical protein
MVVDPADFLGDVPCNAAPGAMHSYVATVMDWTEKFTLPSSPPTSCSQRIAFHQIVAGHEYVATIEGYGQNASELVPIGGRLSGSPHLVLAADRMTPVAPRWTTECGKKEDVDGGEPVIRGTLAVAHEAVHIRDCHPPLGDTDSSPTPTQIIIDAGKVLRDLGCDQIAAASLTPLDSTLPAVGGILCGSPPVTYTSAITAGQTYQFYLAAQAVPAGPVVWGALCFATAREGLTVSAVCDPLVSTGAISLDPVPLFASKGYACPGDIREYQAEVRGGPKSGLLSCQTSVQFASLDPGDYEITIKAPILSEEKVLQASCSATVEPGRTTTAVCF